MQDIRSHFGRMFIFTRVVELGSFVAASRELGTSTALVSGAISELERALGVQLLARTTRKLMVTQAGARLLERATLAVNEARCAFEEAQASSERPAGVLRVTSTSVLVDTVVAPILARLGRELALASELVVDDAVRDLVEEGFDVGVRIGAPKDSSFLARFIGETREAIVASPAVAEETDVNDIGAVRGLPWIAHAALPRALEVTDTGGAVHALRFAPRFVVNTGAAQRALLLSGAGASIAIGPLVAGDVRRGDLVELLPRFRTPSRKVYAVTPAATEAPFRVRVFLEALAQFGFQEGQ